MSRYPGQVTSPPLGDISSAAIPAQQLKVPGQQCLAPGGKSFPWEDGKAVVSQLLSSVELWEGPQKGPGKDGEGHRLTVKTNSCRR